MLLNLYGARATGVDILAELGRAAQVQVQQAQARRGGGLGVGGGATAAVAAKVATVASVMARLREMGALDGAEPAAVSMFLTQRFTDLSGDDDDGDDPPLGNSNGRATAAAAAAAGWASGGRNKRSGGRGGSGQQRFDLPGFLRFVQLRTEESAVERDLHQRGGAVSLLDGMTDTNQDTLVRRASTTTVMSQLMRQTMTSLRNVQAATRPTAIDEDGSGGGGGGSGGGDGGGGGGSGGGGGGGSPGAAGHSSTASSERGRAGGGGDDLAQQVAVMCGKLHQVLEQQERMFALLESEREERRRGVAARL